MPEPGRVREVRLIAQRFSDSLGVAAAIRVSMHGRSIDPKGLRAKQQQWAKWMLRVFNSNTEGRTRSADRISRARIERVGLEMAKLDFTPGGTFYEP
jgi:hypothetical protein